MDEFERDGVRYVVAREDAELQARGVASLTSREREVIAALANGCTTKEAAFALGISDVTVRVLVRRAALKLEARSRAALLAHPDVRVYLGLA